jgi:hypothetical protein
MVFYSSNLIWNITSFIQYQFIDLKPCIVHKNCRVLLDVLYALERLQITFIFIRSRLILGDKGQYLVSTERKLVQGN